MSKSVISLHRLHNVEQTTIYLIEQQLKSRRFFDELENIGLGYYEFAPNLDHLILKNIGRDDGSDKTYSWYTKIIDRHCKQVKPGYSSFKKQAALMYKDLIRWNKVKKKGK